MKATSEITDDTLDQLTDPDEDGDEPFAMAYVILGRSDGMRWGGSVNVLGGEITPDQYAEALVSALHGAARTHSPATARAVERWLVVPPDLEVT